MRSRSSVTKGTFLRRICIQTTENVLAFREEGGKFSASQLISGLVVVLTHLTVELHVCIIARVSALALETRSKGTPREGVGLRFVSETRPERIRLMSLIVLMVMMIVVSVVETALSSGQQVGVRAL